MFFEPNSKNIFPNTDIKGGIAITYRDEDKKCGAIGTFIPYDELKSTQQKIIEKGNFQSLESITFSRGNYRLSKELHKEHSQAHQKITSNTAIGTNIFSSLPHIFTNTEPQDGHSYLKIIGLSNNKRVWKYVRQDYVQQCQNLDKYKVFIPKANGSGMIGEVLSTPLVGLPLVVSTESFISIGAFETEEEANACFKYIKTKFARALLGILKVTQDLTPEKFHYIPLQNFTPNSFINWEQEIADIDRELYVHYGLSKKEIEFIETRVKEME